MHVILSFHLCLGLPINFFPSVFTTKSFIHQSSSPFVLHAPPNLTLRGLITRIIFGEEEVPVIGGSVSPRRGACSGCGWRNGLQKWRVAANILNIVRAEVRIRKIRRRRGMQNMKWYMGIKCQLDATDDFYCRSYCLLNMFRAPLCPSSGAREYCTGGCCLWCLVLWFSSCRYGVELRVMCTVCGQQPPV